MNNHLSIELRITGDAITAITDAIKVVKSINEPLNLQANGFSIRVSPTSDPLDLIEIYRLNTKLQSPIK